MNEAEKALIFHTLGMLIKLQAEQCPHPGKADVLNGHATLLQDIGIRMGGNMVELVDILCDGNEEQRRREATERLDRRFGPDFGADLEDLKPETH